MTSKALIELLEGEADLYDGLETVDRVVLYGSGLVEDEITDDVDLLLVMSADRDEYLDSEKEDVRQAVLDQLKDKLGAPLEVEVAGTDLNVEALAERGVPMHTVYQR